MKKLISLLLAMALCLTLLSGCAAREPAAEVAPTEAPVAEAAPEAPADEAVPETSADETAAAIATPVLYTDYQTQLAAVYGDAEITWQPLIGEESLVMVALLNGTTPCVYLQVSDGYIQQLAVELTGPMTEDSIMTFVALSTYATSALLTMNGVAPEAATQTALPEVYGMFNANLTGTPVDTVFGLPCAFNLIPASETAVTFYYMLDLSGANTAAAE